MNRIVTDMEAKEQKTPRSEYSTELTECPRHALPVMDEVLAEAKRRGIEVIAAPTLEVCQLLEEVKKGQAYAILHCTC